MMLSLKKTILIFMFCVIFFLHTDAWFRRRRRRRRCTPRACEVSSWSYWSSCTAQQCGQQGWQRRTRTQISSPSCGGAGCPVLEETRQCYGTRSVDCQLSSWSQWSACSATTCGVAGVQVSTRHKIVTEQCGGSCWSTFRKTQQCYGTRYVNCQLSSWSQWSACSATTCGVAGVQVSTRHKIVTEQCGGSCSSTFRKTQQCYGTRYVNCQLSSWSQWSACSATTCGVAGVQVSTRHKIVTEQCGGTCSSTFRKTKQCYGTKSVKCQLSSWSQWNACSATTCGVAGVQVSTRHKIVTEQCGGTCSSTIRKTQQCYGTKSVKCQLSSWSQWNACSATTCGVAGVQVSTRHKIVTEQCGGTCPSTFRKTQQCYGTRSVDCQLSSWSKWSPCSAPCGVLGDQFSTRRKIVTEQCGGTCASTLRKTQQCYGTRPVHCQLSPWSEWSPCSTPCGVFGDQFSTRHKIVSAQCGGTCTSTFQKTRACPELICLNGGSLKYGICFCAKSFTGDCCEAEYRQQCNGSKAVNCHLSAWSEWNACSTPCGVSGVQSSVRHRIITEQCGGTCTARYRTRACSELSCLNGGSLKDGTCFCKEGLSGYCCEKGQLKGKGQPAGAIAGEVCAGCVGAVLILAVCYWIYQKKKDRVVPISIPSERTKNSQDNQGMELNSYNVGL